MRWQSSSSSRSSGTCAVCSHASGAVAGLRARLTGGLAACLRAAPRTFTDFDLAPIAPSCWELNLIVAAIAAALLILVKENALLVAGTRHRTAHRAVRQTATCLICVTSRRRDLRSPDDRGGRGHT